MFCPWRSRQAHADYMLSCLPTKHFLTLGQSIAWHPDEVLRYLLMKHCMGTRKKAARFPPETVPLLPGTLCFSSKNVTFCILTMDTLPLKQAVSRAKRQEKRFSVFRLHGFTGRQTPVNERDSVKDGVKAWKFFHGEWEYRRTFVCDAPNGLFPAFTATRLQSARSGETSPGHIPCFRWKI